jgi:hypothetical protein
MVAASALEGPGTLQCCGMNSMVSTIRSCPVVEQYTLASVVVHSGAHVETIHSVG